MKVSILARKKLGQIFCIDRKTFFEISVRNNFIYKELLWIYSGVLCDAGAVNTIIERATVLGIEIIGMETSTETEDQLEVFVWEDYQHLDQSPLWCKSALKSLFEKNPNPVLRFYINIPEENISRISELTGIPF